MILTAVFSNLAFMKEPGVEAWLETDASRWSCKECGSRFNWYSETCDDCGTQLYNAVSEEKDLEV